MSDFCAAPFMHLSCMSTGDVLPCCLREDTVLGSIKESSLAEIFQGERAEALREEFRSGNIRTCAQDIETKQCNRGFAHFRKEVEANLLRAPKILRLDVRLNGRCNLECVSCGVWEGPNGVYDSTGFWEEASRDVFPQLRDIMLLGGEPFIQKDTYRLFEEVSKKNPHCRWLITTNAQWKLTSQIKSKLDPIAIEMISVSIDSLREDLFARLRKKGSLKRLEATLDDLIAYNEERLKIGRGFKIRLNMVVQRANYLEVLNMARYAEKKGIGYSFIFLEDPHQLSLRGLPIEEKHFYIQTLKKFQILAKDPNEFVKLTRHLNPAESATT